MPFQITKTKAELLPVDAVLQFRSGEMPEGLIKRLKNRRNVALDANCIFILPQKDGRRLVRYVGDEAQANKGTIAAIYHDVFKEASKRGWKSVAIPLCPADLPSQEVYQIACGAIREALEDYDLDIYLAVDSKSQIRPKGKLLSRIREFIDQQYVEPERPFSQWTEPKLDISALSRDGESQQKKTQKWPLASVSEELIPPTLAQGEEELAVCPVEARPPRRDIEALRKAGKDGETELSCESRKRREESAFFTGLPNPAKPRELEKRERETVPEADVRADTYGSFFSSYFTVSEEAKAKTDLEQDAAPSVSRFDPATGTIRLDESFSECVLRLIDQKGMSDPECYGRANLSRAVFNKLKQSALNPEKAAYKPSKSTALALAVALELGPDEAKDLLQKAGYAFSYSSKGDIIVEYFLANRLYDIFELNEVLFKFGEPLLGSL